MKTLLGPGGPSTMVAAVPERVGEREIVDLAHLEGVRVRIRADGTYPPPGPFIVFDEKGAPVALPAPKPPLWRRAVAWVTRRAA